MLVLVTFKIRGFVRFLSHAEMMKVFQRGCVRSGFKLHFSEGYNPHPKISLPLPKSVGVEADEELLCLSIESGGYLDDTGVFSEFAAENFKAKLAEQLPRGCELLEVKTADESLSLQPYMATYRLFLRVAELPLGQGTPESQRLKALINRILSSEEQVLERFRGPGRGVRRINVRSFIKSIKLNDNIIVVECSVSSAGTIRVDEILRLLGLEEPELGKPVRRTEILWKAN